MRAPPALLVLALLALLPTPVPGAVAQAADGDLTILVYHAAGGRDPDPLATPLAPPPFPAERLPVTMFDRAEQASRSPENQPASAPAHYRELQRLLTLHASAPAPVAITLGGALAPGALEIDVALEGVADRAAESAAESVAVELVVFEHDEAMYAARVALATQDVSIPGRLSQSVRLDPAWTGERLGVVAIVRDGAEVLQSATWLVRDDAPVTQTTRAVLLEHVTASWCEPCRPADEALALLAEQRGAAGGLSEDGDQDYLRAPTWRLGLGLALGGAAAVALVRRSRP